MNNIIEIRDLTFEYNDNIIFKDMNININEGDFVTISGKSGKTTLVKILQGLLKYQGKIKINNNFLKKSNMSEIIKQIGVVNELTSDCFRFNTVYEEIIESLENKNFNESEIKAAIENISKTLGITSLLDYTPKYLSGGEKQLVLLAKALVPRPKVLILDDALSMMDGILKDKIMKILKKINREQKVTILNFTNDLEQSLYSKKVLLIDKKVVLDESIKKAYEDDKIYKKLNLELPFMVSLSNKLHYYGLVDDNILDMDKMVDYLWK